MKPGTLIVTTGLMLTCAALAVPAEAQSARITIGAVFGTGPQRPPSAQYPGRPGGYGGYGGYNGYGAREYALNRGYNDGYEQGFEAARDRDRFDPRRERWYRDARARLRARLQDVAQRVPRHLPAGVHRRLRVRLPRRAAWRARRLRHDGYGRDWRR